MSTAPANKNPFPGLRPFTQEEDYLFFGREEQTLELLQRLGSNRFVAVVGTSGSGKSSLVRCGLLSELLGGKMLGAGASWEIAVTHPGGNPLSLLTDALLEADLYDRKEEHARENLLATLSRSQFGLVEAVKQADLGEGTNFLLVADQFEEIFRFHEAGQWQQEAANEFVSLLLEAAAQKEVPIYVVLTMRSDFIGECGQFEGLAEMVNRGEFLIPRLTREQYKRVIEGPIKVAGGQIEPRLLQRLLNDLGQQADQLPCLQHALMRTWDVWAVKGDTEALDLDDYQRVGKMSQALSLHADEIYQSLTSDRQRELCQGMFQALTVEESNSRGIRRPQRLGRLCQILEVSADELLPIIDAYRRHGVTFLMPSPEVALTDQTIIDISHESLMRVWTRLRQWVEEETQAAGIYHRLSESAALNERGKAGLYRDPELGIALAWREAKRPNAAWADRYRPGFATAIGFLEASQQASVAEEQSREAARQRELEQSQQLAEARQIRLEQQQRAASKLRKLIAGLAIVALVAGVACVVAMVANKRANDLAVVAKQKSDIAEASAAEADRERKAALQAQQETANALTVAESQKLKAEAAERSARAAEEEGRKLLYTTDMQLVPFIWKDPQSTATQLRSRLKAHIPEQNQRLIAGKDDRRGFEWQYYQHLLDHSAAVFSGHSVGVVDAAFTANGQLVTLDQNGQVRRWDLDSQAEDTASRYDLPGGPKFQAYALSPNGQLAALAEGKKVHVFDTSTGKETFQLDSANQQFRDLIFSRDNHRIVIVDSKIRWCNAVSGEVIASFDRKFDRAESIALSADGLTLAVVGHGNIAHDYSLFRLDASEKTVIPLASSGLTDSVSVSALSPDGQRFAIGERVRGALHGYVTAPFRYNTWHGAAHVSPVSAIAFSGDGAKLATADSQGTIKIWNGQKLTANYAGMRPVREIQKYEQEPASLTLKGHQGAIRSLAFSSDGKRLVSTSVDRTARVWNLENAGAAIRPLERYGWSLKSRFSPDGQLIASSTNYRRGLTLWDATTGRLVRELATDTKGTISTLAFSPTDYRLLAVGYFGQQESPYVALWDIDAGTELARLPAATEPVGALGFSPDGKYLVGGFDSPNSLKVWEVATRRLIHLLDGDLGYCSSLDFSRDGTQMVSVGQGGKAVIWSTATWKATQKLQNPDGSFVRATAFMPDGKTLAMGSNAGNVQLLDVATGNPLETLKGHSSQISALVFSPDGRTLATGSHDLTVRLWNVETRRELMQLDSGSVELGTLFTLAFSPDGRQLLAGGWGGGIWSTAPIVWNDADRATENLKRLLNSNADFRNRIRMLSENLRLHEAMAKLDSSDMRVPVGLAAAQANWHASRQAWPEAAAAFDRLVAADPGAPEAWLRTPGLLRLATALFHQNRPSDAARLLQGGAKRRTQDGLPAIAKVVGFGFTFAVEDAAVRVTGLEANSPASHSKLAINDVIVKVNGVEMTKETIPNFGKMIEGNAGTKITLTLRHVGGTQEDVDLVKDNYLVDEATGELFFPLLTALEKRLAEDPRNAGLLELRTELELAAQEIDFARQVANDTALLKILADQPAEAGSARLRRLYRRRGDAYIRLTKWSEAVDDYAHVITPETIDVDLLVNRARANEALKNWDAAAADWSRAATGNPEGAKLLVEFARRLAADGQVALADTVRTKARTWLEEKLAKEPDNPAWAAELAQLLLDARHTRFPAILRGEDKPADNAERLAFAKFACDQQKFAFATRLWAEALASDPKLADDRQAQPRYNAACAAALAAAGQDQGEPSPDDAAKAKFRGQALDWLRADLALHNKQLESDKPADRDAVQQTLFHWQQDTDLAGIRDAASLSKLPPDEQQACTQLWADVAALLKKREEKPK